MPQAFETSYGQKKRTGEKASGSRKKVKAHRKLIETSLTADDVELIAATVKDQLSEVWANVENHRASIMEQIQEIENCAGAVEDQGRAATERETSAK
jgi:gas vesicle protein